jgi:hypothetical protein
VNAITEREEVTTPAAGICEATVDFFGIGLQCVQPAAGRYRRICVHEHVRDGLLCRDHASGLAGICLTCAELDGGLSHECPIAIAEVSA